MRIMSFSWTTPKLIQGKKTVTRRKWKKQWVKEGDLVQAYNRSPRSNGKKVAIIRILYIWQEQLRQITDIDEMKEGGLWGSAQEFINAWLKANPGSTPQDLVWRIEFEIVRLEGGLK